MQRWLPTILLVLLLVGFRTLGAAMPEALPNFQPLPAMLLCGIIFLKGSQKWLVPLIAWLVTDPLASLLQNHGVTGWHHFEIALGMTVTALIARQVRPSDSLGKLLGSAALSAFAFHFLTNLVSFLVDPLYPKSLAGLVQAQWSGPLGYGPTWPFLRNLLAANLLFTSLFLLARRAIPASQSTPSPIIAR